jgi:hypothetical protein
MLTKERLADTFRRLVRAFPGVPSYQDREALRTQDKVVREGLAARLDLQIAQVDRLKSELTNQGVLGPLAELDRLTRRLQRLADTIRFARYGYSGMHAANPVNEAKLADLYEYDLSLADTIHRLAETVTTLKRQPPDAWTKSASTEIGEAVDRLEEKVNGREMFFQSDH